jgi:hypothetical protein
MTFLRRAPFIRRRSTGTGIVNPLDTLTVSDLPIAGSATASASFNTDGTITYTGSDSFGGPASWYIPSTINIGVSYWLKVTLTSGSAMSGASTIVNNTITQISSNLKAQWTALAAQSKTATASVQIYSDSGGTNLVSTGTIDVIVQGGA